MVHSDASVSFIFILCFTRCKSWQPLKLIELGEEKWKEGRPARGSIEERGPAALLAEPLGEAGDDDDGGFGVGLADLVSPVVPLCLRQIGGALLRLAARLRSSPTTRSPPGRGGRKRWLPRPVLLLPGRNLLLLLVAVVVHGRRVLPGLLLPSPLRLRRGPSLHGGTELVGRRGREGEGDLGRGT